MITKTYKGIIFKKLYKQWVNQEIGGFKYWKDAKAHIDNLLLKIDWRKWYE